jgi:ABC-type transport system substrate-binding protein
MACNTLFALDERGKVQFQMVSGTTISPDGLTWPLTLRHGLMCHDGTLVLTDQRRLRPGTGDRDVRNYPPQATRH